MIRITLLSTDKPVCSFMKSRWRLISWLEPSAGHRWKPKYPAEAIVLKNALIIRQHNKPEHHIDIIIHQVEIFPQQAGPQTQGWYDHMTPWEVTTSIWYILTAGCYIPTICWSKRWKLHGKPQNLAEVVALYNAQINRQRDKPTHHGEMIIQQAGESTERALLDIWLRWKSIHPADIFSLQAGLDIQRAGMIIWLHGKSQHPSEKVKRQAVIFQPYVDQSAE